MSHKEHRTLRAALALLVVLLVLASVTTLAQDEDVHSQGQQIDMTPVVLSQTMEGNTINTVVEIPVAQDTYITSKLPNNNWCTSNFLRVGYAQSPDNYGAVRTFLRFDLSSIPTDAVINSARFRIYQNTATPAGDSDMRFESRHLLSDWNECQVTWNNHQPQWGGVISSTWVGTTIGWLETDASQLVRDWVYGTHPNYGALLLGDETPRERERIFFSRDDAGGRYPRLIIDYSFHADNEPPQASVNPLPQWSTSQFTVSWGGTDPGGSGIDYYDIQYRIPGYEWTQWLYYQDGTSAEFKGGANGVTYEFRARGVDTAGNVQEWSASPQAWTKVDSIPPAATVDPLPQYTLSSAFTVSWSGTDNAGGSGIKHYDLQYQQDGGPWLDWLMGTTALSAQATGAQEGVTYGFRVRATDYAGNVQPWSMVPQATTTVHLAPVGEVLPFDPHKITDPNQNDFMVYWKGQASPELSIKYFNLRYRYANESWMAWQGQQQTQLTQALFTIPNAEDGPYCFQVQVVDSADQVSEYMGQSCVMVDRYEPFLEPAAFLPIVYYNR